MTRTWMVVVLTLAGCDEPLPSGRPASKQKAEPVAPVEPRDLDDRPALVQVPADAAVPQPPGIQVFEMDSPMSIAVVADTLMWTDPAGALWTMPARGGPPVTLSHQHLPGRPMYQNLAAHAGDIVAARRGELVLVKRPRGPLEPLGLDLGSDQLLDLASDGKAIYATSYENASAIYKIAGGTKTIVLEHKRAGIAVRGGTLYAASYSTGTLVAVSTGGGKPRTIARGLLKPTGFDVDDTHAFVWSEKDGALRKIDLATGKVTVLAKDGLDNSDTLVADGDWIYIHTWLGPGKSKFLRVKKDGSATEVLADELTAPYDMAVTEDAVFVSDRDQNKIIRFDKQSIRPL